MRIRFAYIPCLLLAVGGGPWAAAQGQSLSFVGASYARQTQGVGTLAVAQPTGVAAGDLLVLGVYADGNTATVTPADTGWQLLDQTNGGASNYTSLFYYRFATASDPSTYNFSVNAITSGSAAVLLAYSGADPAAPIFTHSVVVTNGSPFVLPVVSTTAGGTLVLLVANDAAQDTSTWTAPAGTVGRSLNGWVAAADLAGLSGGASPAESMACSQSGSGGAEALVIAPAGGGGTGTDGGSGTGLDGGQGGSNPDAGNGGSSDGGPGAVDGGSTRFPPVYGVGCTCGHGAGAASLAGALVAVALARRLSRAQAP